MQKKDKLRGADEIRLLPMPGVRLQDFPQGQSPRCQAPESEVGENKMGDNRAVDRKSKNQRGDKKKLRKYYLVFLVLYLSALILAGANQLIFPGVSQLKFSDTVFGKVWVFIWSLMPSGTFYWCFISLIVLVILIILGFVAGCKLIVFVSEKVRVHFMRKEEDQRR